MAEVAQARYASDVVQFHELFESFHHVHHHARTLFGYFPERKHILAQPQRNTDEHQFTDATHIGSLIVKTFNQ